MLRALYFMLAAVLSYFDTVNTLLAVILITIGQRHAHLRLPCLHLRIFACMHIQHMHVARCPLPPILLPSAPHRSVTGSKVFLAAANIEVPTYLFIGLLTFWVRADSGRVGVDGVSGGAAGVNSSLMDVLLAMCTEPPSKADSSCHFLLTTVRALCWQRGMMACVACLLYTSPSPRD